MQIYTNTRSKKEVCEYKNNKCKGNESLFNYKFKLTKYRNNGLDNLKQSLKTILFSS